MSQFNRVFGDGDYFECPKCNSLATIDKDGKLMRMIFNTEDLPIIYEEQNKNLFIDQHNNLKCNCVD